MDATTTNTTSDVFC